MSNIAPLKVDLQKMIDLMESPQDENGEPWDSESMARAVYDLAFAVHEERSKYVVLGRLYRYGEDGGFHLVNPEADQTFMAFGPYKSEAVAKGAGYSLAYGTGTGEQWRWRAVPITSITPAKFHGARKDIISTGGREIADNPCNKIVETAPGQWETRCIKKVDHMAGYCVGGERIQL